MWGDRNTLGILLTDIGDEKEYQLEWLIPKVDYLAPVLAEGVYGQGARTRMVAVEMRENLVGTVGETI